MGDDHPQQSILYYRPVQDMSGQGRAGIQGQGKNDLRVITQIQLQGDGTAVGHQAYGKCQGASGGCLPTSSDNVRGRQQPARHQ